MWRDFRIAPGNDFEENRVPRKHICHTSVVQLKAISVAELAEFDNVL